MNNSPEIDWTEEGGRWENYQIPPDATVSEPTDHGTLFLYLDESGNFDFTDHGTSYFIMTCLASRRPFKACHDLMDLKYDCFEKGIMLKKFHAAEDASETRQEAYRVIARYQGRYSAYSVLVDKDSLPDDLKDPAMLYSKVFEWIMEEVFPNEVDQTVERVMVVTDDLPKAAKKKQVSKPLKKLMKSYATKMNIKAWLEHYPSESDFNLQIADYACWAFMRRETGKGEWPYGVIEGMFVKTGHLTT